MHTQEPRREIQPHASVTTVVNQKQASEQNRERQCQLAFEQVGLGMAYIDTLGTVFQANSSLCTLLGYTQEEMQRRRWIDSISLDDRAEDEAYLEAVASGASHTLLREERYLQKNGQQLWCQTTLTPVVDGEGNRIRSLVVTVQDISMRREQEEYVRRLLQDTQTRTSQLEAIFETLTDNVIAYDTDERLLRLNGETRQYSTVTNFDEEYNARSMQERVAEYEMRDEHGELIPYNDLPMKRALRGEVLKGDNAMDMIFTSRGEKPTEVQVSLSCAPIRDQEGRIVGAVVISRDVTERRRLERQTHEALNALVAVAQTLVEAPIELLHLSESSARTQTIAQLVQQRIVDLTGRVVRSERVGILPVDTDRTALLSGTSSGFPLDQEQQWFLAVPEGQARLIDLLTDLDIYTKLQARETVVLNYHEHELLQRLPWPNIGEVMIAPIHVKNHLIGILYADHTMNERKYTADERVLIETMARICALAVERERNEQERTRLLGVLKNTNEQLTQNNIQLAQVNKLQSDFISIVSHEFRTTLTGIQGFSELLRDEEFNTVEVRDFASDIHTDALRLTRMISELLDLERMKLGKMTLHLGRVDFNTILRDVAERTRSTAAHHHVVMELDEHLPSIEGDYDKLIQVVTNLVSNAVKYSPAGGTISIRSMQEDEVIHVSISDQGVGIPAEALEDVFVPYNRVESGKTHYIQGTGLGLAIVREIIQMHAGCIWVESVLEEGSTFHFTLPLVHMPVTP